MSKTQKVVKLIANAAKSVGDRAFESALDSLGKYLDSVPEELHFYVLNQMWGDENGAE